MCYLHKRLRSGPHTAGRHTHSSCRVHVYLLVGDRCTGHINTALKHTNTHWDKPHSNWLLLWLYFNQDLVWMYESLSLNLTHQGQVKRSRSDWVLRYHRALSSAKVALWLSDTDSCYSSSSVQANRTTKQRPVWQALSLPSR